MGLTAEEFAQRWQSCQPVVWCVAASIVADRNLADDVVQEAAVIALGKLDTFKPGTSFSAWMAQIVRYTALNWARARRSSPGTLEDGFVGPDRKPTNGAVAADGRLAPDQDAFDDQVQRALWALSEPARACLLLKTVVELDYREIAEVLGLAENTAMSHVHRARARMRELLRERQTPLPSKEVR